MSTSADDKLAFPLPSRVVHVWAPYRVGVHSGGDSQIVFSERGWRRQQPMAFLTLASIAVWILSFPVASSMTGSSTWPWDDFNVTFAVVFVLPLLLALVLVFLGTRLRQLVLNFGDGTAALYRRGMIGTRVSACLLSEVRMKIHPVTLDAIGHYSLYHGFALALWLPIGSMCLAVDKDRSCIDDFTRSLPPSMQRLFAGEGRHIRALLRK